MVGLSYAVCTCKSLRTPFVYLGNSAPYSPFLIRQKQEVSFPVSFTALVHSHTQARAQPQTACQREASDTEKVGAQRPRAVRRTQVYTGCGGWSGHGPGGVRSQGTVSPAMAPSLCRCTATWGLQSGLGFFLAGLRLVSTSMKTANTNLTEPP